MGCCGRPNNNPTKQNYYERFAYLSSSQIEQKINTVGSTCPTCQAITLGDPCKTCGNPKNPPKTEG